MNGGQRVKFQAVVSNSFQTSGTLDINSWSSQLASFYS
jgi:hypothetical protein